MQPLVGRKQAVFRIADIGADRLGRQKLFIDIQLLEHRLDHPLLIVVIIDGKAALIAQLFDIAAQYPAANAVERADPRLARVRAGQAFDAFAHFARGFIGKSQGQDMPGLHAVFQQIGHAVGQRARFAAARPGQNQHRAFQRFGRAALHGVQIIQVHACILFIKQLFAFSISHPRVNWKQ